MKYCRICGLPETYPNIQFDEEGNCNLCKFFEAHRELLTDTDKRRKIFDIEIEKAKEKAHQNGAPYDCVVGLSGGKDSTYIVWQMKHTYGMRVLAVTFQNGFQTAYGQENIENALLKLDVDHITVRMKESELRKQYRKSVSILKNFCSVCFHFMHYYCHQIAGKYGIPLIVNGRTKGQILQSALEEKRIEPFEISHNLREFEYQMFGKLTEKLAQRNMVDYLEHLEVTSLSYFAYHDVSEEETMEFLEQKLGWKRPEHGIPHADCWAHAMAEHLSIVKRGYPIRTGELAVLVRSGELSNENARETLKQDYDKYQNISEELKNRFYKRIADIQERNPNER